MRFISIGLLLGPAMMSGCQTVTVEKELEHFIRAHVARVEPLSERANLAYWDAATTGRAQDYERVKKLQFEVRRVYSNRQDFVFLKNLRDAGAVKDAPACAGMLAPASRRGYPGQWPGLIPLQKQGALARQLDKLYLAYLQNQVEPRLLEMIVDLDNKIQEKYNTFRGTIDGQKVTMSDIYTVLTTEKDCRRRELAWRASKQVGNAIVADLIQLVKLRNEAARKLGFDNYHSLSIIVGEQDPQELDRIFAQLDRLTAAPYGGMKDELDRILANIYGIAPWDLMPWHYHDPFFQRTPLVYDVDFDVFYKDHDVRQLATQFYAGVGLPVDDILARSDLYDREGKYPHAFSHDVDRRGDVRVLCNLQNTERWMETILHELGHAIYSKYHDPNEPWLLREPAHSFTTEGIAVLFGRLSRNAAWMHEMLGLSQVEYKEIDKVSWKYTQFGQILFARWAMVMYYFEKQLYADPDQDLNSLWWDLVEKYQLARRPPGPVDAGWASKLHFTTAPCYYHNYMLGELFASQLHHHIVHQVLMLESDEAVSYVGQQRIGDYLRADVLGPGARYYWNETIARATGEPLTPKYFVSQFIDKSRASEK